MIEALQMKLEIVRTVLKNEVNEISVCVDQKRETGEFYTLLAIYAPEMRKKIALWVATEDAFLKNTDYVGSFLIKDTRYLLFRYHPEIRLCDETVLRKKSLADRKKLALQLIAACAQTGFSGQLGDALLKERNINIDADGKVYFNYFIDFKNMNFAKDWYYQTLSRYVFQLLAHEYIVQYHEDYTCYPHELQVYYRKMQNNSFTNYYQLLTTVQQLPDKLVARRKGIWSVVDKINAAVQFVRQNSTKLFVIGLVVVTVCYLGYQIYMRVSIENLISRSTVYGGLTEIGEVYLGEEVL